MALPRHDDRSLTRTRYLTQYDQVVDIHPYSLHLPCLLCLSTLTLPLLSQCCRSEKLILAVIDGVVLLLPLQVLQLRLGSNWRQLFHGTSDGASGFAR